MTEAHEQYAVIVTEPAAVMPVIDMHTATDRRNQIVQFVKTIMVRDTDYGIIPGTGAKPTLLKPGAEKLTTFFGLTKRFAILEKVEDWDKPFFYYLYRCSLYRGELLIAEADGSCNSHESKYRYRQSERLCPKCKKPAIIAGKAEYGGGYICFAKKGGCGAKFSKGDPAIEGQTVGRIENLDVADQTNTIQKMAQKRALVAATLLAVNASEFFTQDVEDMIDAEYTDVTPTPKPAPEQTPTNGDGLTKAQRQTAFFRRILEELPYYKSAQHVGNTLKHLGITAYSGTNDDELYQMLSVHAAEKDAEKQLTPLDIQDTASNG